MCEHCHSEDDTRALHIDPALKEAGWGVVEASRVSRNHTITLGRLEGYGRRAAPLKADYVLIYRNAKIGIIEAKEWHRGLTEGVGRGAAGAGTVQEVRLYARFASTTRACA
jgi:type I restriction enzyme, R subunit